MNLLLISSIVCSLTEASVYTDVQVVGCLITYPVIKLKMFSTTK